MGYYNLPQRPQRKAIIILLGTAIFLSLGHGQTNPDSLGVWETQYQKSGEDRSALEAEIKTYQGVLDSLAKLISTLKADKDEKGQVKDKGHLDKELKESQEKTQHLEQLEKQHKELAGSLENIKDTIIRYIKVRMDSLETLLPTVKPDEKETVTGRLQDLKTRLGKYEPKETEVKPESSKVVSPGVSPEELKRKLREVTASLKKSEQEAGKLGQELEEIRKQIRLNEKMIKFTLQAEAFETEEIGFIKTREEYEGELEFLRRREEELAEKQGRLKKDLKAWQAEEKKLKGRLGNYK